MKRLPFLTATLSSLAVLASCGMATSGDNAQAQATGAAGDVIRVMSGRDLNSQEFGTFDRPWAARFIPGTSLLFVTEKPGTAKVVDTTNGEIVEVTGLPEVDYGGQGGLGDVAFAPAETVADADGRTIYLSWAEAGEGDTRGAVVGMGTLSCAMPGTCEIIGLTPIWRQAPKVTGRGHYSHRITFSPDGEYLFISSGDRQKMDPAQDVTNTLGTIVRLLPDGTPAPGNIAKPANGQNPEIWSYGHRNVLGLQFDAQGRLWDLEHGPAGGDELNLVKQGANYGWPRVSDGDHYNGTKIPRHSTSDVYAKPAISWNPVIAPGDFLFYSGDMFADWQGQAIIAAMDPAALVLVAIDGTTAREVGRIGFEKRLREVVQAADGAIWVLEDGEGGRLLRLTPG